MDPKIKVISFPKCGRTWFTMILGRIIQNVYGLPESFVVSTEKSSEKINEIPKIKITHEGEPHKKTPKEIISYLSQKKKEYNNIKTIILIRDIRDVFVSHYFHMKKRKKGKEKYKKEISNFIRRRRGGADSFVNYYNYLEENRDMFKDSLIINYEDLLDNPLEEIKRTLKFMKLEDISDKIIKEAIEYCSFKNMKEMEKQNKFNVNRLKPGKVSDPESYKVRKGQKGGYISYLNKKDIKYLNNKKSLILLKK